MRLIRIIVCAGMMLLSLNCTFATSTDQQTSSALTSLLTDYAYRMQANSQSTQVLHFLVKNDLAQRSDDELSNTATMMQNTYPTSTVEELRLYAEQLEAQQRQSLRKILVAKSGQTWVREECHPVNLLSDTSTAPLAKVYVQCLDTTDSIPLYTEIPWTRQAIMLESEGWINFPDVFRFGTLTEDAYALYLNLYINGENELATIHLEEIGATKSLTGFLKMLAFNENEGVTTKTLAVRTEFSALDLRISKISVKLDEQLLSEISYANYTVLPNTSFSFPNKTIVETPDGSTHTYEVIEPFTWPGGIGFWNQGPSNGFDCVETVTQFVLLGFTLFASQNSQIPAGLVGLDIK